MEIKNKRKILIASSTIVCLLIVLSIAFSALSSSLNITFASVTQNALTWNVGFKGSSVTPKQEGTSDTGLSCGVASVTPSTVTIADSTLSKPDDKCTYPLIVENTGDVSAVLEFIAMSQPTNMSCSIENSSTMVCGNISFKLLTKSGADFTSGVTINPGEEYALNLVVHYTGTTLSSTPVSINSSKVTFTYKQASDRTSSEIPDGISEASNIVCKRATTLHTQTCAWVPFYIMPEEKEWAEQYAGCYTNGYREDGSKGTTTITYGNLGTSVTLASGDAFDCDVNGDGEYDAETERFYYLSQVDGDSTSEYAALIYYSNVSGGVATTSAQFKYNSYSSPFNNSKGPESAYYQLPSTEQWPNVHLSTQTRQIYAENGSTATKAGTLPVFTYARRAARLLSYKEVNAACGITVGNYSNGQLNTCEFLMERTTYVEELNYQTDPEGRDYWLETPPSGRYDNIYNVNGQNRVIGNQTASCSDCSAVRPVIEVPLTDIEY